MLGNDDLEMGDSGGKEDERNIERDRMTRESRDLRGHVDRTGTAGCRKQKHALTPTSSLHIVCPEQPTFDSDFQKSPSSRIVWLVVCCLSV